MNDYLNSITKQFEYYKLLGEKAMRQVSDEQLFVPYNEASNSMATIAKHLWGNMLSRWTDFMTSDGEKTWRQRDAEFENDLQTRSELMKRWNEGWRCLFNTLQQLNDEDLNKMIYIRNQGHSVIEAINRQLAHYPYHIGQMVFIAKMIKDSEWQSLSIPKGASQQYNNTKFAQPKSKQHFTDEYLDGEKADNSTD